MSDHQEQSLTKADLKFLADVHNSIENDPGVRLLQALVVVFSVLLVLCPVAVFLATVWNDHHLDAEGRMRLR